MRRIVGPVVVLSSSIGLSSTASIVFGAELTGADTPTLQEVVVTATKIEERIQDVALPMTAISAARLTDLQARNFEDYAKLVPGLSVQENRPGQTQLTLQGISSFSGGATVGVYVDDTPYGSSSGLTNGQFYTGDLNTYDVQRLEVLKGPQGTLYGASTLGGLLKFVTNPPDPSHFAAEVQTGTQSTRAAWGWSVTGMVNMPVSDSAAFRVSGLHERDPGYIDDPSRALKNINSSTQDGVRASFLIKPLQTLSIRLTAVGQDTDYNDNSAIDARENSLAQVLIPLQPLTGDLQVSQNASQYTHTRYRIYNAAINWELGFASLVSATSYGTLNQAALTDDTQVGSSPPVLQVTNFKLEKLTEELRLQSASHPQPGGNQLDYLLGGYFTREIGQIRPELTGTYTALGLSLDGSFESLASTYKEVAAFATLTYHFTPQFDVAVGGRYAHNKQTSDLAFGGPLYAGNPEQIGGSSQGLDLYSIAPRWKPTEDVTVYARVASGYRPGGPNVFPIGLAGMAPSSFKEDTVVSADLGVRSEFLDHRLAVDVSAFDMHWRGIQLVGLITLANGMQTSLTQNGGTAQSRGIEGQATWLPLRGLTFALNGAFTDAKLTQDTTPEVGGLNGDPLPYVPRWTAAADINYEFPVAADTRGFAGALLSYVGKQRTQFNATPAYAQIPLDSYTTLDLRVGLRRDRWTAQIFCKNVTDQRGITGLGTNESANVAMITSSLFPQTVFIIRPRTVGLNLTARF